MCLFLIAPCVGLQCVTVACPGYAYLLFNAIGLSLFNEKWREKEIIEKYKSKQQQKQIKIYPALTASTVDRQNAQIPKSRILDIFTLFKDWTRHKRCSFFPGAICACTRRETLSM